MQYVDSDYVVEPFDHVRFDAGVDVFDAQVVAIHPRSAEVTVRYWDTAFPRRDGEPRKRRDRVSLDRVELDRRDG